MEPGRKAVGSPAHTESLRVIRRLKELVPKVGQARAAEIVGCCQTYAGQVANGKRGKGLDQPTIESLELRRSGKLCRGCGNPAILATRSHLCVVCELLELAKRGLITIEPENSHE